MKGRRHFFGWDVFFTGIWLTFFAMIGLVITVYGVAEIHWLFALTPLLFIWVLIDLLRNAVMAAKMAPMRMLAASGRLISLGHEQRELASIIKVRFAIQYTKKSVNLVPSGTDVSGFLVIDFQDGTRWFLRTGAGILIDIFGSHGAGAAKEMVGIVKAIQVNTGVAAERITLDEVIKLV